MSMGGMIAQELALRHPNRVRSLALLCTTPGGPDAEPADVSMESPQAANMTPSEAFDRAMAWLYNDAWARENREELLRRSVENAHLRISPEEFARQRAAIAAHDTSDRLSRIDQPVLILAGVDDPLIPISNPRRLHRAFPEARMVEYPGRHYFHIEFAEDVNRELLEFFSAIPEHAAGARR
jgi:3-oxoadipate enol-lactonase